MGNFNKSKCSLNTLFYEKIIKVISAGRLAQNPGDINSPAANQMFNDCLNLVDRCAESVLASGKHLQLPVLPISMAKAMARKSLSKSTL